MRWAAVSATFLVLCMFAATAYGQVVVIGPDGKSKPPSGNPEYCAAVEPLRPNLVLALDTTVRGRVIDQTTFPLRDSPIELRRFISEAKQQKVKKLMTDTDGKFDLGVVKRGEYRLLLSPHRGFKQPEKLECSSRRCTLETVLIVSPTDQAASSCPIR
jgi:hypothetical protein